MSAAVPLHPTLSTPMSWLLGTCEWASRIGIYLLPLFYLAFFATLFLLWREQQSAFWLIAAASVLGWTMALWALVFCLASVRRAAAGEPHLHDRLSGPVRRAISATSTEQQVFPIGVDQQALNRAIRLWHVMERRKMPTDGERGFDDGHLPVAQFARDGIVEVRWLVHVAKAVPAPFAADGTQQRASERCAHAPRLTEFFAHSSPFRPFSRYSSISASSASRFDSIFFSSAARVERPDP